MEKSEGKTDSRYSVVVYTILGLLTSASCYYLDQARGAAFVIVPYVTLFLCLKELDITRKTKPELAYPIYGAFIIYAIAVEYYIFTNPIAR